MRRQLGDICVILSLCQSSAPPSFHLTNYCLQSAFAIHQTVLEDKIEVAFASKVRVIYYAPYSIGTASLHYSGGQRLRERGFSSHNL